MKNKKNETELITIDDICQDFNLDGINKDDVIVFSSWMRNIKTEKGKYSDGVSVYTLSKIVTLYIFSKQDSDIDYILETKKKFKNNKLRIDKKELSEILNLSKYQVTRALNNLERLKLIKKEYKTIHDKEKDIKLPNRMFIIINIKNINKITEKEISLGR